MEVIIIMCALAVVWAVGLLEDKCRKSRAYTLFATFVACIASAWLLNYAMDPSESSAEEMLLQDAAFCGSGIALGMAIAELTIYFITQCRPRVTTR